MPRKWFVVLMLFLAGAISYMDRAALSIAAPLIAKDLNLGPARLGIVFSAFFVGYSVFCFVGGHAADRFGAKRVLLTSMGVWSVFCGLTAAAMSVPALILIRVVFGAGEGPYATCTNKMISGWFDKGHQTSAVGFANAGQQFGGAIAGPIVGFLALSLGWRPAFIVIALLGLAWVLAWALLVSDGPGAALLSSERTARSESRAGSTPTDDPTLRQLIARPAILATSFAFFGYAYILYFFLSWFPSFLTSERHLSVATMSVVGTIPWVCGTVGVALGGWVSDLVAGWTCNALLSRKLVIIGGLLVAAFCVAVAGQPVNLDVAVGLMAAAVFSINLTLGAYWGIILDTVRPDRMGGVGGFMHLIANTAGILAPAVTGFLVQWTGLFASAFLLSGAVALGGALAVAIFVRSEPVRSTRPAAGRAAA